MSFTINSNNVELTRGQEVALQHVKNTLASDPQAAGHEIAYTLTITATDYGFVWFKLEQDIPTLGEGNMLRVFTAIDSWFIHVGPRGALHAKSFPNYAKGLKKVGRIHIG